jgi:RNA:NAD 2'-phosphotransferase (TPT1/KptA family)
MDGPNREKRIGRIAHRILTRRAQRLNMTVHKEGYVPISELLNVPRFKNRNVTSEEITTMVTNDTEDRFTVNGTHIKANSGHVFDVNAEGLPVLA